MKKNDKYWESSHSSNSKKNLKRKIVNCIKKMNKNLRDDPLWKGRLVIKDLMTLILLCSMVIISGNG